MTAGKKLIAVFEDNAVDCFIYERTLARLNGKIDFLIFTSPDEGFDMTKKVKFDLIIINIHFWATDFGIHILKQLQKSYSCSVPFIAATSLLQENDLEKILSHGFSQCIEKPAIFKEINTLINYC